MHLRELERELVERDGDVAARGTLHDGDWGAPVTLPRHQPVPDPVPEAPIQTHNKAESTPISTKYRAAW